jgi:2-dehydro-3-deoxyphosphogluconate aldolase/(4S)-4-hydroxy-2-oxoglutarate aldolase
MQLALTPLDVLQSAAVLPVITLHQIQDAVPLAQALLAGGIRMLEVTLRTPQSLACIEAIARNVPEVTVGAGSVCLPTDAARAAAAGARFAVSPGFTLEVAQACRAAELAWIPGVATGSEIMQALAAGYSQLKFFPAVPAGGVAMLQAWSGPFAYVQFCPTGGIHAHNAPEFLALSNVVCVGGSWVVPTHAIQQRDWQQITDLAGASHALGCKENR